jgi:hypothetical protein
MLPDAGNGVSGSGGEEGDVRGPLRCGLASVALIVLGRRWPHVVANWRGTGPAHVVFAFETLATESRAREGRKETDLGSCGGPASCLSCCNLAPLRANVICVWAGLGWRRKRQWEREERGVGRVRRVARATRVWVLVTLPSCGRPIRKLAVWRLYLKRRQTLVSASETWEEREERECG